MEEQKISLTIQDVSYSQDEMDTPARLRAFNNIVGLQTESVQLDDRRIDNQIRTNGWINIFIQLMNEPEPVEVVEENTTEKKLESDDS
tara:strand:- start:711 stop:974 length:264 start_codon:yes stop_codon:yes gene_type:complete